MCPQFQGAKKPQEMARPAEGSSEGDHGLMEPACAPLSHHSHYALEPCQGRWVAMLTEGDLIWEKTWGWGLT